MRGCGEGRGRHPRDWHEGVADDEILLVHVRVGEVWMLPRHDLDVRIRVEGRGARVRRGALVKGVGLRVEG